MTMARQTKESANLSCKIAADVSDKLTNMSAKTGLSKTVIIEKAVREYCEKYDKTGKI